MEQVQKWDVCTRQAGEYTIFTRMGLSFEQALSSAGLMWADVLWIRPAGVEVVHGAVPA